MARQVDSRRLPGASLFGNRPGAILDVKLEGEDPVAAAAAWEQSARRLLDAVGWTEERTAWRVSGSDLSLFLSAPVDALYAATEVNERAWANGGDERAALELRAAIEAERNPRLVALVREAFRRGVTCLPDDHDVSVGMGLGARVYPIDAIPDPGEVPWDRVHDIPAVLVTGTNGKSTTVRLLGSIVAAWGRTPGLTTTDGLRVGNATIGSGDYSGPEGARRILRDGRVEVAILETARGGIQRRGLALRRVVAAAVTNLAEDHLGEFGMNGLDDIAGVKLVVARAVGPTGRLVANADDPELVSRVRNLGVPLAWFSLDARSGPVRAEVASLGDAAWLEDGRILLARGGSVSVLTGVDDVPVTFRGRARHNVGNALAAALLAVSLGLPDEVIARGLAAFGSGADENPGRANLVTIGGVTVVVDFAHNPHGMEALVAFARAIPAERRLILIGQAGDRDDHAIRALARAAWELEPDVVVLKEMSGYLRGRASGEIPGLLDDELRRMGAKPGQIVHADSEVAGVRIALEWARDGDLLVLPTHADRDAVMKLLESSRREQ